MTSVPDPAMPIAELNLSVRTYNCLTRSGLRTVADVLRKSRAELTGLRSFGANQYLELRIRLLDLGFPPPDESGDHGGAGTRQPRPPRLPPPLSAAASAQDEPDEQLGTLSGAVLEMLRGHGDNGESTGTRVTRPHPLPPLPPSAAPFDEPPYGRQPDAHGAMAPPLFGDAIPCDEALWERRSCAKRYLISSEPRGSSPPSIGEGPGERCGSNASTAFAMLDL